MIHLKSFRSSQSATAAKAQPAASKAHSSRVEQSIFGICSNPIDENIYQFDRELISMSISNNVTDRRSHQNNQDLQNVDV